MGLFGRIVIATRRVAMSAQHRQLVPYLRNVAADNIAGVGQTGDRAQGHLFAAAGDHYRRTWFLHRLRLEDRILDVEIPDEGDRPKPASRKSGSSVSPRLRGPRWFVSVGLSAGFPLA